MGDIIVFSVDEALGLFLPHVCFTIYLYRSRPYSDIFLSVAQCFNKLSRFELSEFNEHDLRSRAAAAARKCR